jgi:hypothetical protein
VRSTEKKSSRDRYSIGESTVDKVYTPTGALCNARNSGKSILRARVFFFLHHQQANPLTGGVLSAGEIFASQAMEKVFVLNFLHKTPLLVG